MHTSQLFRTKNLARLFAAMILVLGGCSGGGGGPKDASGSDGDTTICSSNSQCPKDKPVCSGGVCEAGNPIGCQSDADCDAGTCDTLTGQCSSTCTDCCTTNTDCTGGATCVSGHCKTGSGTTCTTVNDCDVAQICSNGTCQPYDPSSVCTTDADCPKDHHCNALGDGSCQGCLNDGSCINSPNGPKCDDGTGNGPGAGYCYHQCGATAGDCPQGQICDTSRGGLCVPACSTNADCQNGQVCHGGQCQACTTDSQCNPGDVCSSSGACVPNPGCTDAQCKTNLGQAYYCDGVTNQCQLGCTASGCTGGTSDCNPCSGGATCDTSTGQCSGGGGCDCTSLNCSAQGKTCDSVQCACVTQGGGGGGNGGVGASCVDDTACQSGLHCYGALPQIGLPGQCSETCDMGTLCQCTDPSKSCGALDIGICLTGGEGLCQ